MVTPDGAEWAPRPRVDNAMVKALARAFRWTICWRGFRWIGGQLRRLKEGCRLRRILVPLATNPLRPLGTLNTRSRGRQSSSDYRDIPALPQAHEDHGNRGPLCSDRLRPRASSDATGRSPKTTDVSLRKRCGHGCRGRQSGHQGAGAGVPVAKDAGRWRVFDSIETSR